MPSSITNLNPLKTVISLLVGPHCKQSNEVSFSENFRCAVIPTGGGPPSPYNYDRLGRGEPTEIYVQDVRDRARLAAQNADDLAKGAADNQRLANDARAAAARSRRGASRSDMSAAEIASFASLAAQKDAQARGYSVESDRQRRAAREQSNVYQEYSQSSFRCDSPCSSGSRGGREPNEDREPSAMYPNGRK